MGVGNQVVKFSGAGNEADVGHADERNAVPAFSAHSTVRAGLADRRRRFPRGEIADEEAFLDDRRRLRGHAFVVEGERAHAGAVRGRGVGDDVHNVGGVFQRSQFLQRQEAHAGEICLRPEHAVKLDRVPD